MQILWESFVGGFNSMGIVSENNILALDRLGASIYVYPWNCSSYFRKSYFEAGGRKDADSYKSGIAALEDMEPRTRCLYERTLMELDFGSIQQLTSVVFSGMTHLYYIEVRQTKTKIGYFFNDTTSIPLANVKYFNSVLDHVFVVSSSVKEAFIRSGVRRPITIWHHGIDPDVFSYHERTAHRSKFRFLFVGVAQKESRSC